MTATAVLESPELAARTWPQPADSLDEPAMIRTPDQRVRVFVSSTLQELSAERQAVRDAVTRLRLAPVMFELAARPHSPRQVYRSYLAQSQVFVGVYWQSYGWAAPGEQVSGLEDEYRLSAGLPRLIYVKTPAPQRDPRLARLLDQVKGDDSVSYQHFSDPAELQRLVENDLAVLLSERFQQNRPGQAVVPPPAAALPAPATPMVARELDTAAVTSLVTGQEARLITLTGPGGVGKSRLAVAAASQLASTFADGARFVDLASVMADDLVPGAIAARLGVRSSGGSTLPDMVSYLRSRHLLLVLDNFEQVTGAAPVLADLLAAAPGLVVLVTSRTVMRLRGEYDFPVAPLPVPSAQPGTDPDELAQYPAVQLFVQRAKAADPGFLLTDANAQVIGQICRRLDGLPLAIELAAVRIRMLPPRALLARLDGGLSVLADGPRDLPERQRTLKATLDWSFGLLPPDAQALFTRLGVFAGSFGLRAAGAVCAGGDGLAAGDGAEQDLRLVDTLGALADSSLIRLEADDGQPRFTMLDTIREYALERLRASDDWAEVHQRHASYFQALAGPRDDELQGSGQLAWLNRLETRHADLAAALSWLVDAGQIGPAVQLVWATWRFWWLHGHAAELSRYVGPILAGCPGLALHERALALGASAFILLANGQHAQAEPLFEQSLPLFRQAGDPLNAARTANPLGHLRALRHDDRAARELLEENLRRLTSDCAPQTPADRAQRQLDLALADNFLGQVQLRSGDRAGAARLFGNGLAVARSAADRFTILVSLYDLARCCQARGDLNQAAVLLAEGLSLADEAGDRPSMANYLEALAEVASGQDHPACAVSLLSAADGLIQASGRGWLHAYVPRAAYGDSALAALRGRISPARFQRAWQRGRAMEGTAAVRHALASARAGS